MRKGLSAAILTAMLLASCGPSVTTEETRDVLFLRSGRGVVVVEAGSSSPSFRGYAEPSHDWSTVVRTSWTRDTTLVTAVDPLTKAQRWRREIDGSWSLKVVSQRGDMVALGPQRERHHLRGRGRTELTIVTSRFEDPLSLSIKGNFEPEAFSTDGGSLFVVKYLPAKSPSSYQVRRIDLDTGQEEAVYTPDAHLQQAMAGTARIQASSPDGSRLYTLYTIGSHHSSLQAFVHVLSLDELWAHCIDLPEEFAQLASRATSLSVSPDGKHLYVANARANMAADVDTEKLAVVQTIPLDIEGSWVRLQTRGFTHAVQDHASRLYFAAGRHITVVDADELTEVETWTLPEHIRGLQITDDSKTLYVGLHDHVAVVDTVSGETIDTIDPPGVRRIYDFGPVIRSIYQTRANLTCAC